MKFKANKRLMRLMRVYNYVGLAEQWVESMAGEPPRTWDLAFFADMFPGCRVALVEVALPLPQIRADYRVHVHMECDAGVFTLAGTGDTYEAALVSAVWDSERVTDNGDELTGTNAPF